MIKSDTSQTSANFDPVAKEQQLRSESDTWDTSQAEDAQPGDIPVIDLQAFFRSPDEAALTQLAEELRVACETVGFFSIVGHQVPASLINSMFDFTRKFHALPISVKQAIAMDRSDWPVGGMGYLPVKHRKLPARAKGNLNEAFIVKCGHNLRMDDNQWPGDSALPGFREVVEQYTTALEGLGKRLLPIFAQALEMQSDYFDEAFVSPLYRLRLTHYPPQHDCPEDEFGIAPHVDTTFCTILAQDRPGLTIFSERSPAMDQGTAARRGVYRQQSGELLRTWTNDRFHQCQAFRQQQYR